MMKNEAKAPASDFEYFYSEPYKGIVINKYTGNSPNVYIPDEIEGKPVVRINDKSFHGSSIESVYIPESATEIGDSAFFLCKELENLTIPGNAHISAQAFYGCVKLKSITFLEIPSEVHAQLKRVSVGNEAFCDCRSLESIEFHGITVLFFMTGAFKGCRKLKSIAGIPERSNIDESAFDECEALSDEVKKLATQNR